MNQHQVRIASFLGRHGIKSVKLVSNCNMLVFAVQHSDTTVYFNSYVAYPDYRRSYQNDERLYCRRQDLPIDFPSGKFGELVLGMIYDSWDSAPIAYDADKRYRKFGVINAKNLFAILGRENFLKFMQYRNGLRYKKFSIALADHCETGRSMRNWFFFGPYNSQHARDRDYQVLGEMAETF